MGTTAAKAANHVASLLMSLSSLLVSPAPMLLPSTPQQSTLCLPQKIVILLHTLKDLRFLRKARVLHVHSLCFGLLSMWMLRSLLSTKLASCFGAEKGRVAVLFLL